LTTTLLVDIVNHFKSTTHASHKFEIIAEQSKSEEVLTVNYESKYTVRAININKMYPYDYLCSPRMTNMYKVAIGISLD